MIRDMIILTLVLFLSACNVPDNKNNGETRTMEGTGIVTEKVKPDDFSKVVYVSINAEEKGNGTKDKPFKSITEGLKNGGGKSKTAILVAEGTYEENDLEIKNKTELYGGYSQDFKERDVKKYNTTLSGSKKGRIMTLDNDTKIDGFTLIKGQVRGKGGAVFTTAKNVTVSNNIFVGNKTLKPIPWNPAFWHETANDGGAIYCGDSAVLIITNNIFLNNTTENGRGAAVAAANKCVLKITDNVFFKNTAGLDDPMRSSDGGAIAIFRWSNADIENNIILSNTALNHNDAGGIWLALWSSAKIKNNVLVDNQAGDDAGAIFVGGQEHRYDAPLDPIPPRNKFFVSIEGNTIIGNRNLSMNSGAMRLTMESRGEFINNVTAFNNGIYFQRSEVLISGNTILDNFLLVETKKDLNPCIVKDNIIWAGYTQKVKAEVTNNNMLYPPENGKNYSKKPNFKNDGVQLTVASANYYPRKSYTEFTLLTNHLNDNELANRVVKVGDTWSIVKSNTRDKIELWGNLAGKVSITLLPTYKISN